MCSVPRRQTEVAVKEEEDHEHHGGTNVSRFEELVEAIPIGRLLNTAPTLLKQGLTG